MFIPSIWLIIGGIGLITFVGWLFEEVDNPSEFGHGMKKFGLGLACFLGVCYALAFVFGLFYRG